MEKNCCDATEKQHTSSVSTKVESSEFEIPAESNILGSHNRETHAFMPASDRAHDTFNQIGMHVAAGSIHVGLFLAYSTYGSILLYVVMTVQSRRLLYACQRVTSLACLPVYGTVSTDATQVLLGVSF